MCNNVNLHVILLSLFWICNDHGGIVFDIHGLILVDVGVGQVFGDHAHLISFCGVLLFGASVWAMPNSFLSS